jgi:uncharacterized protein
MSKLYSTLTGMAVATALIAVSLYATFVEPDWIEVTQHSLPAQSPGKITLVLLSDLHMQSVGKRERKILTKLNNLHPDMIVLSGDVIDKENNLPVLSEFLQGLPQTAIIATLGNWEHWSNLELGELRSMYAKHHAHLLVNESRSFNINGRRITITGLDDLEGHPALPNRHETFEDVTEILVQHSPGYFDGFNDIDDRDAPRRYSLCLSGHTHGGQVTLFGKPLWTPPGSGDFVAGMYETPVCPLYVSRGLGTSVLPVRLGARPEMAIFSL